RMELEQAALIDGATRWQVFRHVALPIARPGIAVAFILAVIFSWDNFVFGIVLAGRETRTLPLAVYNMIPCAQLSWGPLAAAALIVTFPVLLLTVLAQRQIVAGLTAGAVKGGGTTAGRGGRGGFKKLTKFALAGVRVKIGDNRFRQNATPSF